jgi:hypothetical protein
MGAEAYQLLPPEGLKYPSAPEPCNALSTSPSGLTREPIPASIAHPRLEAE